MTIDGYLAARIVEGSFDSQEFYDFVAEEVVSLQHFLCLLRSWIFFL
jgi:hypothetical protein